MLSRLLILLLGSATSVWAQVPPAGSPDVYWRMNAGTSVHNEVNIRQAGTDHQTTVMLTGLQNGVTLSQTGLAQLAELHVTGQTNQCLLTQTGERNRLTVGLAGTNNQLRISQDGGDVMSLAGLQTNNARLDLIQKSGNNTLVVDGPTLAPNSGVAHLKIEQTGGASARIQHGPTMGR
ncbi:hypothetical protein BWI93_13535 [Siphonobacter sp. BAB-5385]|uniref:hypothetical protein n=1 Tax=unclassified Siphonobacter TaxID=2635712 RepID=UPI000B9E1C04|nr:MULTISPECIES: hypothetical protein [unclassified Siphonobacter]OZI07637.1 hypothetical protein BWI93_13535 [Siphonobacter sp. BAB-5385]PMD92477.1 hypothetical protein BWI97_20530 [Siphonobacter sp. BAB-5405]